MVQEKLYVLSALAHWANFFRNCKCSFFLCKINLSLHQCSFPHWKQGSLLMCYFFVLDNYKLQCWPDKTALKIFFRLLLMWFVGNNNISLETITTKKKNYFYCNKGLGLPWMWWRTLRSLLFQSQHLGGRGWGDLWYSHHEVEGCVCLPTPGHQW